MTLWDYDSNTTHNLKVKLSVYICDFRENLNSLNS